MGFFKRQSAVVVDEVTVTAPKPAVIEGWSESELVAVYNAAPARNLRRGEPVFPETGHTDSFFVLLSGSIQVVVKWAGHAGRPGFFGRGDCVAPLPKSPNLTYCAEAAEASTVVEITPTVLHHLPDRTQLSIYKVAVQSTSKINAYIRAVNGEISSKNTLLANYILKHNAARLESAQSDFVRDFLRGMPRMPAYATSLAGSLLDDRMSVKEVVEGINRDPSIVGLVLRNVNSAQFSFQKKIESFYNACMIMGFNNIYNLIMREAVQSAMPKTAQTVQLHQHSCLISVLCYEIASAAKEVQCQTATTFGLLHDIGKGVQTLMKITHPDKSGYIDALLPSKLTADLLSVWGLPDRICKIIEFQHYPEFMPPHLVDANYRRECATLYLAHVLQSLMTGEAMDPTQTIYAEDYLACLGLSYPTPTNLLQKRVLPILMKNLRRLPDLVRGFVEKAAGGTVQALL